MTAIGIATMAGSVLAGAATLVMVAAERLARRRVRAVAKMVAAAGFVAVGGSAAVGPGADAYARWIAVGLLAGAAGDAALLGHGTRAMGAGMGMFALGHGAYLMAISQLIAPRAWLGPWAVGPVAVAVLCLGWLWRHLGVFRAPVTVYIAILTVVVIAAWSPLLRGQPGWLDPRAAIALAAGATLFFASDVSVARNRFVRASFWNKAWGTPCYVAAQLLIAWSAVLAR